MIQLKDIRVIFSKGTPLEHVALNGITLQITKGEFVTVIGGNGAGKSTLMNVLSGDLIPDGGSIVMDGKDVTLAPTQRRAAWVSRVFQDPLKGSCPNLSVQENMALAFRRGQCRGLKRALNKQIRKHFYDAIALLGLGLEKRLQDPMGALSGGQRQALSLLMATLQPAKILLLDEHTAALDPKMAHVVLELTQNLIVRHGLTALMITHSMHQALHYGTRTLMLHHGKLVKDFQGEERKRLAPASLFEFFDD